MTRLERGAHLRSRLARDMNSIFGSRMPCDDSILPISERLLQDRGYTQAIDTFAPYSVPLCRAVFSLGIGTDNA